MTQGLGGYKEGEGDPESKILLSSLFRSSILHLHFYHYYQLYKFTKGSYLFNTPNHQNERKLWLQRLCLCLQLRL